MSILIFVSKAGSIAEVGTIILDVSNESFLSKIQRDQVAVELLGITLVQWRLRGDHNWVLIWKLLFSVRRSKDVWSWFGVLAEEQLDLWASFELCEQLAPGMS